MSKKVNPAAVGVFVAGAVLILLVGLIVLGSGRLFEKHERFVVYFQSSANGLQEGADVLLGGVKVGSVKSMRIQLDPDTGVKVIPVVIELSADRLAALSVEGDHTRDTILTPEAIEDFVGQGLRARLMSKSALTGQLFVDLEVFPEEVESYTFPGKTIDGLPQIPTTKNEIEQVLESIARSVDKISQIEFAEVAENINALIKSLDAKVAELDLKGISDKANSVLDNTDSAVANLDKLITDEQVKSAITNINDAAVELKGLVAAIDDEQVNLAVRNAAGALENASGALAEFEGAAANIGDLTDPRSGSIVRLNRTLGNLEEAAKAIEELADYLKRNPNALLSGKKQP